MLNSKQKLAYKYYKAFGALCCHVEEAKGYSEEELDELRTIRHILHNGYLEYDPDCTFDVSKEYKL